MPSLSSTRRLVARAQGAQTPKIPRRPPPKLVPQPTTAGSPGLRSACTQMLIAPRPADLGVDPCRASKGAGIGSGMTSFPVRCHRLFGVLSCSTAAGKSRCRFRYAASPPRCVYTRSPRLGAPLRMIVKFQIGQWNKHTSPFVWEESWGRQAWRGRSRPVQLAVTTACVSSSCSSFFLQSSSPPGALRRVKRFRTFLCNAHACCTLLPRLLLHRLQCF